MPKRLFAFAAAFALAFAVAGCSSGTNSASSSSASFESVSASSSSAAASSSASASASSASSSSSLFSNDGFPQNEITADVPVPEFSVQPSSISESDNHVSLIYDNVPESEASAYIEAVKAAGFTYSASEQKSPSSYSYSARNAEDILQSTNVVIGYSSSGSFNLSITNAKLM